MFHFHGRTSLKVTARHTVKIHTLLSMTQSTFVGQSLYVTTGYIEYKTLIFSPSWNHLKLIFLWVLEVKKVHVHPVLNDKYRFS